MTRPILFLLSGLLLPACVGMEESNELGITQQELAIFGYQASNTNSATDPNTSADSYVTLNAGEGVMIGTCGITGSAFSGDTLLRLYNPSAIDVTSNDDSCNGYGSKMSYTPSVSGSYMVRAGCYSSGTCSGTVAISRRKAAPSAFSVSNTNNAQVNTFNQQYSFAAGDVIRASTCSVNAAGATASGDTYLRLYRNDGGVFTQVMTNDTAATGSCGTAAEIIYQVPTAGYYQTRVGCSANTACSGNLAVYVE